MKEEFFDLIEKRKEKKAEHEMISTEYHEEILFQSDEDLQRESLATMERLWWELETIEQRMAEIRREAGREVMREWRKEYYSNKVVAAPVITSETADLPF